MQRHVNLVDLVKSFPTNIFLQNLASIQKRTSPVKFAHLAEKSESAVRCRTFQLRLDELEHACVAWAHNNKFLILCADVCEPNMYQGLSPEVRALLNPVLFPLEGHTPPPAKKRRISSLANMFSAPPPEYEPPPTP